MESGLRMHRADGHVDVHCLSCSQLMHLPVQRFTEFIDALNDFMEAHRGCGPPKRTG